MSTIYWQPIMARTLTENLDPISLNAVNQNSPVVSTSHIQQLPHDNPPQLGDTASGSRAPAPSASHVGFHALPMASGPYTSFIGDPFRSPIFTTTNVWPIGPPRMATRPILEDRYVPEVFTRDGRMNPMFALPSASGRRNNVSVGAHESDFHGGMRGMVRASSVVDDHRLRVNDPGLYALPPFYVKSEEITPILPEYSPEQSFASFGSEHDLGEEPFEYPGARAQAAPSGRLSLYPSPYFQPVYLTYLGPFAPQPFEGHLPTREFIPMPYTHPRMDGAYGSSFTTLQRHIDGQVHGGLPYIAPGYMRYESPPALEPRQRTFGDELGPSSPHVDSGSMEQSQQYDTETTDADVEEDGQSDRMSRTALWVRRVQRGLSEETSTRPPSQVLTKRRREDDHQEQHPVDDSGDEGSGYTPAIVNDPKDKGKARELPPRKRLRADASEKDNDSEKENDVQGHKDHFPPARTPTHDIHRQDEAIEVQLLSNVLLQNQQGVDCMNDRAKQQRYHLRPRNPQSVPVSKASGPQRAVGAKRRSHNNSSSSVLKSERRKKNHGKADSQLRVMRNCVRRYICFGCVKSFSRGDTLQRHMKNSAKQDCRDARCLKEGTHCLDLRQHGIWVRSTSLTGADEDEDEEVDE